LIVTSFILWFGGHSVDGLAETPVITGGCVSLTVTLNKQLAELPDASDTVQWTGVVPIGKVEPDAGIQTGAPTPGQLSPTAGAG
jgi:hypothetical protein